MRPTALRVTVLAAALAVTGLPDSSASARDDDWASLAAALDALRAADSVPAFGLVILDHGETALVHTAGARPDTPFRWGSITKSFTALAALQLAREHDVRLDSPIRPVLGPGYYVNAWADDHPILLAHLLELSAGFTDLSPAEFADNEPRGLWKALARNADERAARWPPGLQHSYSNAPPGLTAAIIERVSQSPFEDYLDRAVFEPLGMTGASLDPVPDLPGGYQADGRTEIPYWHVTFKAFGALNASIEVMARFATALLNQGRIDDEQVLPPEVVDAFFTPTSTLGARAGLAVTYSPGSYGWVRGGHVFWGHGGDADGYRSRYGLLRDHGRGYVLVINTDNPSLLGRMRRLVEDSLVRGLPAHPAPEGNDPELKGFTGRYYPASARFGLDRWRAGEAEPATVRAAEGQLEFQRGSRRTRLLPVGSGRFVRPGDPAVTVVFARDGAGFLHLQGELGNFVHSTGGSCPGFIGACE